MKVEPYDIFQSYIAIKLHFESPSYNAKKYNFKAKSVTPNAFFKRKDRWFFTKLQRKFPNSIESARNYIVAAFLDGHKWIGNILDHGDD